jgi:hypothetical protein
MRLLKIIPLAAACALVGFGCTPVKQQRDAVAETGTAALVSSGSDAVTARMDAKWVSAIVGMKIETPAGALLGRVQYGGVMGLRSRYTAIPWATVAEMLDRDRLLVDRSNLENSPLLMSAKPQPEDKDWRRAAEGYWNGKIVAAQ